MKPAFSPYVVWGWANVKSVALGTYTPAPVDRGNSAGLKNTVNHYDIGSYRITMKGISNNATRCIVKSLRASGTPQTIKVRSIPTRPSQQEEK